MVVGLDGQSRKARDMVHHLLPMHGSFIVKACLTGSCFLSFLVGFVLLIENPFNHPQGMLDEAIHRVLLHLKHVTSTLSFLSAQVSPPRGSEPYCTCLTSLPYGEALRLSSQMGGADWIKPHPDCIGSLG